MTEKRFEVGQKGYNYKGHYFVKDNKTNKKYNIPSKQTSKEICELLNMQNELIYILNRDYETLLRLVLDSGIDYVESDELEDLE